METLSSLAAKVCDSVIRAITYYIYMHHMTIFIGVEQNNDVAKRLFFRGSNKWDATTDIVANQYTYTP